MASRFETSSSTTSVIAGRNRDEDIRARGCAFAWPAGSLRLVIALVLLAHLIVIGWMWRDLARADPDSAFGVPGTFLRTVFLWTSIAAFVTTALTLGPALLLTVCV